MIRFLIPEAEAELVLVLDPFFPQPYDSLIFGRQACGAVAADAMDLDAEIGL